MCGLPVFHISIINKLSHFSLWNGLPLFISDPNDLLSNGIDFIQIPAPGRRVVQRKEEPEEPSSLPSAHSFSGPVGAASSFSKEGCWITS